MHSIIKFNPYICIDNDGDTYLFVSTSGIISKINEQYKSFLKYDNTAYDEALNDFCATYQQREEDFLKIIKAYEGIKLLNHNDNDNNNIVTGIKLNSIMLIVCQNCNLACNYCFAGQGEYNNKGFMSFDVAKKSVDYLFANTASDFVNVAFFGGEPLVNSDLVMKTVEYAKELAAIKHKHITFAMTTNATLIDDYLADFLIRNEFHITVSLDGDEEQHNKYRIFRNGTGSYTAAMNGLQRIKRVPNVIVRATMADRSYDNSKAINSIIDKTNRPIYIAEDLSLYKTNDYDRIIEENLQAINLFKSDLNNGLFDRCKKNLIVYNKLKAFAFYFKRPVNCDAAYHSIVIDKEGDIYACHRFVGMKQFVLGNIEEQTSLKEVFVNSPLPDKDKKNCCCKQCWAYNLCSGGCFYDNYMLTGSCVLPDEKRCNVYKTIHLEVLKLFVGLTVHEKTQLCLKK